jgi:hypothetical protein
MQTAKRQEFHCPLKLTLALTQPISPRLEAVLGPTRTLHGLPIQVACKPPRRAPGSLILVYTAAASVEQRRQ